MSIFFKKNLHLYVNTKCTLTPFDVATCPDLIRMTKHIFEHSYAVLLYMGKNQLISITKRSKP